MGNGEPHGRRWLPCRVRGLVGWLAAIAVAIAPPWGASRGAGRRERPVAAPQLNLRAEPGTWAPVVGQLWQGERLTLLDGPTPDDWYQVQAGDQTGWAYGGLLAFDGVGGALDPGPSGQRTAGALGRCQPHDADGDPVRGGRRGGVVLGGDGERPIGRRFLRHRCRHVLRL